MHEEALTPHAPVAGSFDFSLDSLAEWAAETAVDFAARSRAKTQMLTDQQSQQTALIDLIEDRAERSDTTCITLTGGSTLAGTVRAVGVDFMILCDSMLGDVVVPFRSLALILPGPQEAEGERAQQLRAAAAAEPSTPEPRHKAEQPVAGPLSARPLTLFVSFADALVDLAAERACLQAEVAGETLRGELCRAGQDVVTMRLDTPERMQLHIRTTAIEFAVLVER